MWHQNQTSWKETRFPRSVVCRPAHVIERVEAESMSCVWGSTTLADTGCVSSDKKRRDVKSTVQVAACPICSVLWKLLYQSGKRSSRRNSHIYIPIFYTETHIARLIKDSSSRGKARSYRKLVRRCLLQCKKSRWAKKRKIIGWVPWWQLLG